MEPTDIASEVEDGFIEELNARIAEAERKKDEQTKLVEKLQNEYEELEERLKVLQEETSAELHDQVHEAIANESSRTLDIVLRELTSNYDGLVVAIHEQVSNRWATVAQQASTCGEMSSISGSRGMGTLKQKLGKLSKELSEKVREITCAVGVPEENVTVGVYKVSRPSIGKNTLGMQTPSSSSSTPCHGFAEGSTSGSLNSFDPITPELGVTILKLMATDEFEGNDCATTTNISPIPLSSENFAFELASASSDSASATVSALAPASSSAAVSALAPASSSASFMGFAEGSTSESSNPFAPITPEFGATILELMAIEEFEGNDCATTTNISTIPIQSSENFALELASASATFSALAPASSSAAVSELATVLALASASSSALTSAPGQQRKLRERKVAKREDVVKKKPIPGKTKKLRKSKRQASKKYKLNRKRRLAGIYH